MGFPTFNLSILSFQEQVYYLPTQVLCIIFRRYSRTIFSYDDSIFHENQYKIGNVLKLTINSSCVIVTLLDMGITFEIMLPYFKIQLLNGVDRFVTKEYVAPRYAEYLVSLPIIFSQVRK